MSLIDKGLIEGMINGSEQAFEQCYLQYSSSVFNAVKKISSCYATSEDILQETFISAFEKINTIDKEYSLEAWLKRIAFNKLYNIFRHQKRTKSVSIQLKQIQSPTTEGAIKDYEQENLLTLLFSQLGCNERLVVWLYVVEQYSHTEIGDMFGKSVSFSKSIVSRSLNTIRQNAQEFNDAG